MSGVKVRPVYSALIVFVVLLVAARIVVDLVLLPLLVLHVAVDSVIVLVVGYILVELMLLRISVLRDAVGLCSRRPPSRVGGGSAQAELPRHCPSCGGRVLRPSCDRVLLGLRSLGWGWRETRGSRSPHGGCWGAWRSGMSIVCWSWLWSS